MPTIGPHHGICGRTSNEVNILLSALPNQSLFHLAARCFKILASFPSKRPHWGMSALGGGLN